MEGKSTIVFSAVVFLAALSCVAGEKTELVKTIETYQKEHTNLHSIAKRQTSTDTDVDKFTECGGSLTGATGHFYTPFFPYTYPNNSDCVWTIEVPAPYAHIKIDFLPRVHLEPGFPLLSTDGSLTVLCFDAVTIHDGPTASHQEIHASCGLTTVETHYSTSNKMTIRFTSDATIGRPGFMGIYAGLKADNTTECVNKFTHGHTLGGEILK